MKWLLIASFTLIVADASAQGPRFIWAQGMNYQLRDDFNSLQMANDAAGNLYSVGEFSGAVDFDPGPDTAILRASSYGLNGDMYITRMNADGQLEWALRAGGEYGLVSPHAICLDPAGNLLITGYFTKTADFDPGPDIALLSATSSSSDAIGEGVFVVKLTADGALVWARRFGGRDSTSTAAWSITTDSGGHVYVGGDHYGPADFDPGPGTFTLPGSGAFICRLSSTGDFVWVKGFGSNIYVTSIDLDIDPFGDLYLTGMFRNRVDFDPGPAVFNLTSAGGSDVFIMKLDTTGGFIYAHGYGSSGHDYPYCSTFDRHGAIYTTGVFHGTADFDPDSASYRLTSNGDLDVFITRVDSSGEFRWARSLGGDSTDLGVSLLLDNQGGLYLGGGFKERVDLAALGATAGTLESHGRSDILLLKLDTAGEFHWACSLGGPGEDIAWTLLLDSVSNLYVRGVYQGPVDVDPCSPAYTLPTGREWSAFMLKFEQGGCPASSEPWTHSEISIEIHPHPVTGILTISGLPGSRGTSVLLRTIEGRLVGEWSDITGTYLTIDMTDQPAGLYFVEVENGAGDVQRLRFIRQ